MASSTDPFDPKEKFRRKHKLLEDGWGVDEAEQVRLHNSDETRKHQHLKLAIARLLQNAGRVWNTEVPLNHSDEQEARGVVDVIDWGTSTSGAVVYELESDLSPKKKEKKQDQYVGNGPNDVIRDVIVIPASEGPENIEEMDEWLKQYVAGV